MQLTLWLPGIHMDTLKAIQAHLAARGEKLTTSEAIRRALAAYRRELGVVEAPSPQAPAAVPRVGPILRR